MLNNKGEIDIVVLSIYYYLSIRYLTICISLYYVILVVSYINKYYSDNTSLVVETLVAELWIPKHGKFALKKKLFRLLFNFWKEK